MDELAIFTRALDIESPPERAAFLQQACGPDSALRARVEALLQSHQAAGSFLQGSPVANSPPTVDAIPTERPGTQIGPYKLIEQIGEGGMGTVWMAEQKEPVKRLVALKLIKAGMDSRQVIARFEAERQALALMDHPNIAHVLDGGTTSAGRPYFVMDLVRGVPITRYCDEHHLTPRQRLELFIPVCQAIQHAHQKGIIHRDLKPSNVLVALYDGRPVPKVIDFGVAKAAGQPLTEQTLITGFGNIVGTLEYMSPEQAEINQLDIDTRSDIYSLGVLLYELLTGSPPFSRKDLERAGMLEMLRIIREQEPSKPSTKLSSSDALPSLSANRGTEPAKLTKLVRGELDWIVMKALEKDRNRRYETATGFAMDVQRYLADEPVQACPPSAGYRLRKFVRRNKVALAMVSVVAGALVMAVVSLSASNVMVRRERDQKTQALSDKEIALGKESAARTKANEQEALAQERADEARKQARLAQQRYYASQMNLAVQAWEAGDTPRVLELLETFRPRFDDDDFRAFEWYALWQLCHQDLRFNIPTTSPSGFGQAQLAFSPDSTTIALGSSDGTVRLIDAASGREVATWHGVAAASAAIAFSPDGKTLAQAAGSTLDEVILWDVAAGRPRAVLAGSGRVRCLAFTADGATLATGNADGVVKLWDPVTGEEKSSWSGLVTAVSRLALSPDGKLLALVGDRKLVVWDLSVTPPRAVHETLGIKAAFSPDGKRLALANFQAFLLVDTTTWKHSHAPVANWGTGHDVAFTPDGNSVAVAVSGRCVKFVDLGGGQVQTFPHSTPVYSLAVSPDGRLLASIGTDAVLKVWELGLGARRDTLNLERHLQRLAFSPDGRLLAVGEASTISLFNASTGERKAVLSGHSELIYALAFLDTKTLLSGSGDNKLQNQGEVKMWDVVAAKELPAPPEYQAATESLAVAPGGRALVVGGRRNGLAFYDAAASRPRTVLPAVGAVTALTFSPNGQFLISADGRSGMDVTLRDADTGETRLTIAKNQEQTTRALACSPDSKLLATGNNLGQVRLWDLPSGALRMVMRGNVVKMTTLAFFPNGKTLVVGSETGEARLFDVATGQERVTFRGGNRVALSFDGQTLALGEGKRIRLLRASTAPEATARKSELNPDDPDSPLADLDYGDRHLGAGEVGEAVVAYKRARARLDKLAEHFPAEPRYRRELARSHLSLILPLTGQGRTHEAEQAHSRGLAIHQSLPPEEQRALARTFADLGDALRTSERLRECDETLALAVALQPDDPTVWLRRAAADLALGRWEQAAADCEKLQTLAPHMAVDLFNNLAWLFATCPDEKLRNPVRAVELARKAVDLAASQGSHWNTLGVAHYRTGNWKEAAAALEKSMELRQGGDAFDWFFLAMAHQRLNEKEEARRWFDRAVEWMEQHAKDNEELRRFRKEAEELMNQ